jgi:hypothetical protein
MCAVFKGGKVERPMAGWAMDAHLLQAVGALCMPRRQRRVVQQAEAHLVARGGVVPRRTAKAEACGGGERRLSNRAAAAVAAVAAATALADASSAARHHSIHKSHCRTGRLQCVGKAAGGGEGGAVCSSGKQGQDGCG